jgi:DNA-binding CsgD family transcriptional regulator
MELVAALMAEPLVALPLDELGAALARTFEAAGVSFNEVVPEVPVRNRMIGGDVRGYEDEIRAWCEEWAARDHPLLRWHLATGLWVPQQMAALPAEYLSRWDDHGGRALTEAVSSPNQLALPLRATPGLTRAMVIGRPDPWSEPEAAFAERLWRLLTGLEKQVEALAAVTAGKGVGAADIPLTPRERSVLGLLAQGLTAGTIARRLGISPRTVQKHLERCYVKLGVTDRLAAVLRAQALGLV